MKNFMVLPLSHELSYGVLMKNQKRAFIDPGASPPRDMRPYKGYRVERILLCPNPSGSPSVVLSVGIGNNHLYEREIEFCSSFSIQRKKRGF